MHRKVLVGATTASTLGLSMAGVLSGTASPALAAKDCIPVLGGQLFYSPGSPVASVQNSASHCSSNTEPVYDWAGWATFSQCSFAKGCGEPVANDTADAWNDASTGRWSIFSLPNFKGAVSHIPLFGAKNLGKLRNNNRSGRWA